MYSPLIHGVSSAAVRGDEPDVQRDVQLQALQLSQELER